MPSSFVGVAAGEDEDADVGVVALLEVGPAYWLEPLEAGALVVLP